MPGTAQTSTPWLDAPASANTVRVRLIDTTGNMTLPSSTVISPSVEGLKILNGTTVSYLIENERLGKKALFDLGLRKDWWNLAPAVLGHLNQVALGMKVDKDVAEILTESGVALNDIDDIIWSHSHLDHVGDVSRFPATTQLNYGKDIAALQPGYPKDPSALLLETDFAGRINNELDPSQSPLKIGGFAALDFYGDGSFYLLDTPGHAPGHLAALARTTTSADGGGGHDTFVLMAGDLCHFCGVLRPNVTHPFPTTPRFPNSALGAGSHSASPDALLWRHPQILEASAGAGAGTGTPTAAARTSSVHDQAATTPWCRVAAGEHSFYANPALAQETADSARKAFDEAGNVFVALAHDNTLLLTENGEPVLPSLNRSPDRDINDWYGQGWKEKLYWSWVGQTGMEDESGNIRDVAPHVLGIWKGDKKYRRVQDVVKEIDRETAGHWED